MDKENAAMKASGLHNNFSEQEGLMTASAMPPAFSLSAGAASENNGNEQLDSTGVKPHLAELEGFGLAPEEVEVLSEEEALHLIAINKSLSLGQWEQLRSAFIAHGHCHDFGKCLIAFYGRMDWNIDVDVQSLEVLPNMPFQTVAGQKTGHVELVRKGGKIGMRAIVPFEGFGGNMILDAQNTSTVLGRSVESITKEEFAEAMNAPRGTNYFRFQKNMMVGKNEGGGNVLDVQDKTWTWALNNAWLQAAVDRRDRIRFVSDPSKASTLFKRGGTIKDGLTVTGMELGVLMHKGMAPDVDSGEVRKGYMPSDRQTVEDWREIKERVKIEGKLDEIDQDAYENYLHGAQNPALSLKQYYSPKGDLVATQTNTFGGL